MAKDEAVWKSESLARLFLENVRGGVPLAGEQIDAMLRIVRRVRPGARRILDLGCGDGVLGWAIMEANPDARGVFLDFSEAMLAQARTRCDNQRSEFVLADFGLGDWAERVRHAAPFDAVVSGFAIHHLSDEGKRAAYQAAYDLLGPGGVLLNLEHVASGCEWARQVHDELFVDSLFAFSRRRGGVKSRDEVAAQYYHRNDKAANILAPVEEQCRWLRQIGFADVDCFFKLFELALFGGVKR